MLRNIQFIPFHGGWGKIETPSSRNIRVMLALIGILFFIIGIIGARTKSFENLSKSGSWGFIGIGSASLFFGIFFRAVPRRASPEPTPPPVPIEAPKSIEDLTDQELCDRYVTDLLLNDPRLTLPETFSPEVTQLQERMRDFLHPISQEVVKYIPVVAVANLILEYDGLSLDPHRFSMLDRTMHTHEIEMEKIAQVVKKPPEKSDYHRLQKIRVLHLSSLRQLALIDALPNAREQLTSIFNVWFDFDKGIKFYDIQGTVEHRPYLFAPIALLATSLTQDQYSEDEIFALFLMAFTYSNFLDEGSMGTTKDTYALIDHLLTFNLSQEMLHRVLDQIDHKMFQTSVHHAQKVIDKIITAKREKIDLVEFCSEGGVLPNTRLVCIIIKKHLTPAEIEALYQKTQEPGHRHLHCYRRLLEKKRSS